jgi:thiamine biosynthesis lipoprotein
MFFSKNTRKCLAAALIIGWVTILAFLTCPAKQLCRDRRILMGTFWEVISCDKRAGSIVFAEASRIEELLSKYRKDSEIWRLNRSGKLKVSPDTFYIIKKSKEFWQESEGAFDISVSPLVELWGFANQKYIVPSDEAIKTALRLIGSDKIILHEKDNVVEFKLPGMKIDLGAIAKGFALDCAIRKLKENGINNCLINAGGQIYALGDKCGKAWRIAIKDPCREGVFYNLELKNQSVSTSGDYEQFFIKNKKRYCHILDPKKGYPVSSSGYAAVTVIADTGLEADALSTAIFVLGPKKYDKLLNKFPKVKVKIY